MDEERNRQLAELAPNICPAEKPTPRNAADSRERDELARNRPASLDVDQTAEVNIFKVTPFGDDTKGFRIDVFMYVDYIGA